jgi:hypothetical protein
MPAPFSPAANLTARAVVAAVPVLGVLGVGAWWLFARSTWVTGEDLPVVQPVPFSHEHHVGALGIDCRYCHSTVESSSFAGMPASSVCMHCHQQLYTDQKVLEPIRESERLAVPLAWTRVYRLPDFVYFDHSVHVSAGVSCQTCHGRVDQMPLMSRQEKPTMKWCLDCHRHPEGRLSEPGDVFLMGVAAPGPAGGPTLHEAGINTTGLTSCSACHR